MILQERALPESERMDFVSIVTPNHLHFEPAMLALENGFHVVIEKPMAFNREEAERIAQKVAETGLLCCLTHTYSGYAMVKQAKKMIADQALGSIRKIWVEYPQGWLSDLLESTGNTQATWRTDPTKSGASSCMGDIGTHAAHLAEYVTGARITRICADLKTFVPGRRLEDDGNVLLQFDTGATGVLMASQVATGEENALRIRVYGEKGGLEWNQMEPNSLVVRWIDQPMQTFRAGANHGFQLYESVRSYFRAPSGHPEGYIEAFANIYRNFALCLDARRNGQQPSGTMLDFPNENDGVRGMLFIEKVLESGNSDQKWTAFQ
jgi:predicted dehydrogenase